MEEWENVEEYAGTQCLQAMAGPPHNGVCLGKIRVVNIPAWMEEALRTPHPNLSRCWQSRAFGEEESGGCFCCCLVVCFREVVLGMLIINGLPTSMRILATLI